MDNCIAIFKTIFVWLALFEFVHGKGIRESQKNQTLSPYELSMVSDLLIEITVHRCPLVNQPAVKSMKTFIFSTFSTAPEAGVAHPLFYSNYRSMVECLNYLSEELIKKSLGETHKSRHSSFEEGNRKKREIIFLDAIESESEEFNSITSTAQSHGKEVDEDPTSQSNKDPFELLFVDMYAIVKKSCVAELTPNPDFLSQSMQEILGWISKHEFALQAKEKYFKKSGVLKQIHKCSKFVVDG